ncbi:hypothetical protein [Lysobacter olei]
MYWFAIAALTIGLVALVLGYRKNNRNVLAAAAVLLLVAGGAEDFVAGFQEGASGGQTAVEATAGQV